jgi:SAM-dependent methyltransferase
MTPDSGVFREASAYYLAGRPPYSRELLPTLRRELNLDGRGLLIDVGCGPGILALELAPAFRTTWAVDPEPGMLAEARRNALSVGRDGVRWVQGTAEDLASMGTGPCRLVTFGQSYHWTVGVPVLDEVHELLEEGGAVALIGHSATGRPEPATGPDFPRIPEDEIRELVRQYVLDDSAVPRQMLSTPHLYEIDLRTSRFGSSRTVYAPGRPDVVRDIDSVVAGCYSKSWAAPRRFGYRKDAFDAALRELLRQASPAGLFWDWPGDTEIVLATR